MSFELEAKYTDSKFEVYDFSTFTVLCLTCKVFVSVQQSYQ